MLIIFFLTFLCSDKFTGKCYAQWQIQTSGTSEQLSSICFTGANTQTGYAVGHNGVVIKTTNLGFNWSTVNIPTLWNYYSVCFTNPDNGWVVGYEVYRTSNGGQDWTKVVTNPEIAGFKVQFFDSVNGWILGLKVNTR